MSYYESPFSPAVINQDTGVFTQSVYRAPAEIIYNSYAGTDIVAEIVLPGESSMTMGELQTISYSIHRENSPVRLIGHVNAAGFVKGPRTIAGSLIFTNFNSYAFYRLKQLRDAVSRFNLFSLADMLPPFDVVITFSNEYGSLSKMRILGVTIIDEGGTMSVDDLITESTFTYMARGIQPMTNMANASSTFDSVAEGQRITKAQTRIEDA